MQRRNTQQGSLHACVVILILTLREVTTSQLVTPHVTCLFLSQDACQELSATAKEFPVQTVRMNRVPSCTAMDNENDKAQGCDQNTITEANKDTMGSMSTHIAEQKNGNPDWLMNPQERNKAGMRQTHQMKEQSPEH